MCRALVVAGVCLALPARADQAGECHTVDVDFVPAANLQIVGWIEDTKGAYVDTAYITQATGTYGIGNRPGRFDFNSGPIWPYGRRITTFPVWSHAHGIAFPEVEFQDGMDDDLSHEFSQSSHEPYFCRPRIDTEPSWDTGTCPSAIFTDKGVLSPTKTTGYPPRTDITRQAGADATDVDKFPSLNPFDVVSQATPPGGMPAHFTWTTPATVPDGNYVLVVEVSKEFDTNTSYDATKYPAPTGITFANYGEPYRGQPSVVYRVPFAIGQTDATATTASYAGYGDPDGLDGNVRAPDTTISTTVPDSGALRFGLAADGATMYRVRARTHVQFDSVAPGAVTGMAANVQGAQTTISFVAPGDDGASGQVTGYDIRVSPVTPIDDSNFDTIPRVPSPANPVAAGDTQQLVLQNLLPDTDYFIGVKPIDDCHNTGPLQVLAFHSYGGAGEVDACFIATAAYGSLMASDVGMLRHFRDAVLEKSVLGELFVETYYTFGPPVAQTVGASELLRATARAMLAPIVARVRAYAL
jgi:hypothetical protein